MKSDSKEKAAGSSQTSSTGNHPAEVEEAEPIVPYQEKKKSWFGRLFGFFFRIAFYLLLVLIALGFLAVYYFPADAVRPYAEQELSRILKMPVHIGEVKINLIRGVEIHDVALGGEEPLFNVNALILDYDLIDLIKMQKLLINQVTIDQPWANLRSVDGVWNFQPLLDLAKPKDKQAEEEKTPAKSIAPPIPFEAPSATISNGNLEIIPIMISIEIPFPIPFSVILSPSHMVNMVPEIKIITDDNWNKNGSRITACEGIEALIYAID